MAKFWENLEKHEDNTEKHNITEEEITFLKKIQHEMNTQNTVGQADPRYWVIRDYKKVYGKELNSPDGMSIYDANTGEVVIETDYQHFGIDNVIEELLKQLEAEEYELTEEEIENIKFSYDTDSLVQSLGEIKTYAFMISEYQEIPVDKGMFLTHEAAISHLRKNDYHYAEDAHTYAHTAWRSREEKLWEILRKVDFDKLVPGERVNKGILLQQGTDGVFEQLDAFATIFCETKEDYEMLEKLLKQGKKMQWIPVEERLPEEDGEYLCQIDVHGRAVMEVIGFSNNLYKVDEYDFFDCKDKKGFYGYDSEMGYYETSGVIAWMPLPEPMKTKE